MARVVVHQLDARVGEHVVVHVLEVPRHHLRYERLDLADHDSFDRRVRDEAARGHAGAETHDEHGARPLVQQCRQMPEHALELHVLQPGAGLDLAAHVKVPRPPIILLRHRHR